MAVGAALDVADAAILTDNSRSARQAFTVCQVRIAGNEAFDIRNGAAPKEVRAWLDLVAPVRATRA